MNLLKLIKREIAITVVTIIIIVSFFSVVTYAYFMDVKETDLNVIKYGDIELTFCEDAACDNSIENIGRVIGKDEDNYPMFMYPMTQDEALGTVPYIFKLTNTGDLKLYLTIKLKKEEDPILATGYEDYVAVDDSYIYTAFGEQGEDPTVMLYTDLEEGDILLQIPFEVSESKIFNLWTWLAEDAPNEVQGSYFIADISVNAFDKPTYRPATLYDKILADNTAQSDSSINFETISGDGLYYTENGALYGEDGKRVYYFRGRVDNNWVSFGGFLWRIMRTTSEGGVRLAYAGDGSETSSGFISPSGNFTGGSGSKYYVGYTYNLSSYTGTQTNCSIKTTIDNWYNTNLSTYSSYLSETVSYCNDRNERISGDLIIFSAFDRITTNKRPSYACLSTNASRYTVSANKGNGYLQYPIAMISADEIYFAGMIYDSLGSSLNSYIMDNTTFKSWWTMSPAYFNGNPESMHTYQMQVNKSGYLYYGGVNTGLGIRPTISLKSNVIFLSGNGTKSTPYTVDLLVEE